MRKDHRYGKKRYITASQKKEIYDLVKKKVSYTTISDTLKISRHTVAFWGGKFHKGFSWNEKPKRPANIKIDDNVGTYVKRVVGRDGHLSGSAISRKIMENKGVQVSVSAINRYLRNQLYRFIVPKVRDSSAFSKSNIERRIAFAHFLETFFLVINERAKESLFKHVYYVDESSFLNSKRTSKVRTNKKEVVVTKKLSVRAVNAIMCIGVDGVENVQMLDTTTTAASFTDFMQETVDNIREKVDNKNKHKLTFFFDNARVHLPNSKYKKNRWAPFEKKNNVSIIFTPPYTPAFNPIEEVWQTIKIGFYRSDVGNSVAATKKYIKDFVRQHENSKHVFIQYYRHMITFIKKGKEGRAF